MKTMIDNLFSNLVSARRFMADLLRNWRHARQAVREMRALGPEEEARVLSEIGLSRQEFDRSMAGPFPSEDLLLRAMDTFDIDIDDFCARNPAWFQDMERTCMRCEGRAACRRIMARGEFSGRHRGFCPNADDFEQIISPLPAPADETRAKPIPA